MNLSICSLAKPPAKHCSIGIAVQVVQLNTSILKRMNWVGFRGRCLLSLFSIHPAIITYKATGAKTFNAKSPTRADIYWCTNKVPSNKYILWERKKGIKVITVCNYFR